MTTKQTKNDNGGRDQKYGFSRGTGTSYVVVMEMKIGRDKEWLGRIEERRGVK